MRAKTSDWFEVKVRYEKEQSEGIMKAVTEQYVMDALSFTEAESMAIENVKAYINGEFKITDIKPASYKEIFFSDLNNDDFWFKVKILYITIDEKTSKEKRTPKNFLVQAHTLPQAVGYVEEVMGKGMSDYVIGSISETKILDVIEHEIIAGSNNQDIKPEYEEQA